MARSKAQYHQSVQLMFLAIAAVFAVVSVIFLTRKDKIVNTKVQGAEDMSAQEMLYQLNETVDDAGQTEIRNLRNSTGE